MQNLLVQPAASLWGLICLSTPKVYRLPTPVLTEAGASFQYSIMGGPRSLGVILLFIVAAEGANAPIV